MAMKTPYPTKMVRVSEHTLTKLQEVKRLMLQVHKRDQAFGNIAFVERISLNSLIFLAAIEAETALRKDLSTPTRKT